MKLSTDLMDLGVCGNIFGREERRDGNGVINLEVVSSIIVIEQLFSWRIVWH